MERGKIIDRIFAARGDDGFWKMIPPSHKYFPDYIHYVPTFKATLWTLILLADLDHQGDDDRVRTPLAALQEKFFDTDVGIYSLGDDHFPIPCLNGNMIYLEAWFTGSLDNRGRRAVEFFAENQRFDDGAYVVEKTSYCRNKSCYGKHTCYWGVVKLLKGLSFVPEASRSPAAQKLIDRCVDFVLLHKVCYSSRRDGRVMIKGLDRLTFPNMYKSDFLEILWLLMREKIRSEALRPALSLLRSKRRPDGTWNLERKIHNMVTTVGEPDRTHPFVTKRAQEVLDFHDSNFGG